MMQIAVEVTGALQCVVRIVQCSLKQLIVRQYQFIKVIMISVIYDF